VNKYIIVSIATIMVVLPMWAALYFDVGLYSITFYISWLICSVSYDTAMIFKGLKTVCSIIEKASHK